MGLWSLRRALFYGLSVLLQTGFTANTAFFDGVVGSGIGGSDQGEVLAES